MGEYVDRGKDGAAIYGSQFQGQPLTHLREELIDGLTYAAVAQRQLAAYRNYLALCYETLDMPLALYKEIGEFLADDGVIG